MPPFLFKQVSSLDPFHCFIILFLSYPQLPSSLVFYFRDHSISHVVCHSLIVCMLASGALWWDCCFWGCGAEAINISHLSISSHLCYGFTVTNEKSICPVDGDMVPGQRILASCSCFSVMSFSFQFTLVDGGGEVVSFFSCVLCFRFETL